MGSAVACDEDGGGTPTVQGPLAGLRYVNIVSDTGPLDFRVIDILGDAPATFAATFRTGGSPAAGPVPIQTSPAYQGVEAGLRRIKVFNSSTNPATAQQEHLDTTFTFEANRNYTFVLRGFARTGQTPALDAAIMADAPPPVVAGQIAVRTWQLAPGLDPAATTPLDAWVVARGSAPLSGAPTIAGATYPDTSSYVNLATDSLRVAFTAAGTTQPILFQANMPLGGSGIAGTTVGGTAITVLVVPRSVPGSRAPLHFTGIQAVTLASNPDSTATAVTAAAHGLATGDSVIVSGADTVIYNGVFPVTVVNATTFTYRTSRTTTGSPATGYPFWLRSSQGTTFNGLPVSRLTATGGTATLRTQAAHGLAVDDVVTVSGATQPEYNGSFVVTNVDPEVLSIDTTVVVDSTSFPPDTTVEVDTTFAPTFRYPVTGAPASPAAGAPVWRRGVDDFTRPNVMFLIDRRP